MNVKEFANLAGVVPITVRRWVHKKRLKFFQVGPGTHIRIPVEEAERLGLKVRE